MKTATKISALLLAASLTAALQARAIPTTTVYTESIININQDVDVDAGGKAYKGLFTEEGLIANGGGPAFNVTDTISQEQVTVNMENAAGNDVTLTINSIGQSFKYTSSETHLYTLTSGLNSEDSFISNAFSTVNGSFNFLVSADCELLSVQLTLDATTGSSGNQSAPDASSTVILLGGALSALGLLKLKLA